MYARVIKFVLGPDSRTIAESIADHFDCILRHQKGFKDALYLADYEVGEYTSITVWETDQDAYESEKFNRSQLEKILGGQFQWEPGFQYFKVYRPNIATDDKKGDISHRT